MGNAVIEEAELDARAPDPGVGSGQEAVVTEALGDV